MKASKAIASIGRYPPCPRHGPVRKKCGPNGVCALDKGVPWTRGGGSTLMTNSQDVPYRGEVLSLKDRLSNSSDKGP